MIRTELAKTPVALGFAMIASLFSAISIDGGQSKPAGPAYKTIAPITQDNLTVFPIVTDSNRDTHNLLTLDEGLRSGEVTITEQGTSTGMLRPYFPGRTESPGAQVNRLLLTNKSNRPLVLLAGEIVTGGKQDRVVSKERIIPAKSDPVDLNVFCVEPHRWVETSAHFGSLNFSMAQPSVRLKAMAARNQQAVWNEVAKSRAGVAAAVPPRFARALASTSSYAVTMENSGVREKVAAVAAPIEQSYENLRRELRAQKAVGAVVAVNGEIVWADIFASNSLFDKYWPKLIHSYAAEAVAGHAPQGTPKTTPSNKDAQAFLDDFHARRETVEGEPGVYRNTEIVGQDFEAFTLTSLLPGTNFDVHVAKMKK